MQAAKRRYIAENILVEQLRNHEERAFTLLYDNYSPALNGILVRMLGDTELAADVLQDAFVKIWKNIETYTPERGTLFTWMLNVCRNQAIDRMRSAEYRQRQQGVSLHDPAAHAAATETDISDFGLLRQLEQLRPDYRRLIDLVYLQGYTQAEAAEILAVPLGTVKTRLRAALSQLRELLIGLVMWVGVLWEN